ncbi:hypothetical protein PCASD_05492 [Puccinia coronata f. sp. avenae]|uniref:Uncharacterized protein n=1 Tax=Puccinia coronata f. sp. avenae TaxID=200324 RepID=A0A2N5V8S4_9BASI|nr:hypothetical protein PCASD_05492 [Puccinia coronata f. sp. avenae]
MKRRRDDKIVAPHRDFMKRFPLAIRQRLAAMGYGLANDSSHYNEMCSLEQHSGFSPRIHSTEDALKSYKISCGTLLLSELLNPIGNPSLTKPLERRVRGTPNGALSVKDRH